MKHLESALTQENQGWKYFLVFFVGLILGQSAGAIPLIVVMVIKSYQLGGNVGMPENLANFSALGIDQNIGLLLMLIPFLVSLVIIVLLIKGFHSRSILQVINGGSRFRWRHFWKGAVVWGILAIIILIINLVFYSSEFELNFNLAAFVPLVFISLLLIPFQAGSEEIFFRGYLAQGVAAWTKNRWLVILIPAICFALMHGSNPEVKEYGFWATMPSYFLFGVVFGLISILDDGIEMAIGMHSVNNICGAVLVTNKAAVFQTPALFIQKEVDPTSEFWGLLVLSAIFVLIVSYKSGWSFKTLQTRVYKEREIVSETI